MPRVLVAELFHETHCFVDEVTGLDAFAVGRGAALTARRGDASQLDGFLKVAETEGWELIPACSYTATPSGMVAPMVLDAFWADLEPVARRAGEQGVDAVFLSLHGAMVTGDHDDVEGEVLARLRRLPGLGEVPLFGVFDLHANFSARMAALADGLVCYRENPHVDARDTAVRAARLLGRCLTTGTVPYMARRNPGIVWSPPGTGTADLPMRGLEALAREIEAEDPAIWAVNVVAGFSFADTPDTGVSFSVVATGDAERADAALERLCARAHELEAHGLVAELDPDEALARIARDRPDGPALLVEPADNIGGGAPGNGTGVLRALLRNGVRNAGVIIADPEAVAALAGAFPGDTLTLAVGGKGNRFDPGPVELEVAFLSRSDGRFALEDPNSHLAASRGRDIEMGPTAVVRHAGITIVLTSIKTPPFDLGQWRSQGIDPEGFSVIGVKAAVAHRRAYDPIAAASYTVRTPGPCASDPRQMPYRKLPRPIFPFDT